MTVEISVPSVGESITEVTIETWLVAVGDTVQADQPIAEVSSDKADLELPAPVSGTITEILVADGDDVQVGQVIGRMEAGDVQVAISTPLVEAPPKVEEPKPTTPPPAVPVPQTELPAPTPAAQAALATEAPRVMPSAERVLYESGLPVSAATGSGPGGRVLKEDAMKAVAAAKPSPAAVPAVASADPSMGRATERQKMSRMRRTIASRLVEAQQTAALLTTFNEVDMTAVMGLRKSHQEAFTARHGVKLGFMSFFVKAAVEALRVYPAVNAQIDGKEIVYHDYADIGIAVGGGKGLVVPVLKNAERMGFAEIEKRIRDFGARARSGDLALDELQGGTFTITNGGIYGSMLSTPIINAPQSGILGMHNIVKRAVVVGDEIVARPMMYLALTYDHRIVDGREAVSFLVRLKECLEEPSRLLIEA
ncbi:MAG: dihydrolipoyllysine-residue succinyltransferase [Myxococcales bacterium]|nr:dihydrolipoyllysine-residue succinyltransferase [Myxococcales bacterium]